MKTLSDKERLVAYLLAQTAITSVIGNRIYLSAAPQGAQLPFIIYQQDGSENINTLAGSSGLRKTRFQITAIGTDAPAMETVRAAICNLAGNGNAGGFRWIYQVDDSDDYSPPVELQVKGTRLIHVILEIWS